MLRITLAAFHLLALGIGLGAILMRATALKQPASADSLRRVLRADLDWGVAAFLWIGTGLWRYLGQLEKGMSYYNQNCVFLTKMALVVAILILEVSPMLTFIRWRGALKDGASPQAIFASAATARLATTSYIQAVLVVVIVFAAVTMARGLGAGR